MKQGPEKILTLLTLAGPSDNTTDAYSGPSGGPGDVAVEVQLFLKAYPVNKAIA